MSNTLVRPDDTNLSPSRMSDGISKDAAAIHAVNPTADGRSDSVRKFAEPPPAAPPARTSRRGFLMNTMVSAASLATAAAVATPPINTAASSADAVSFPDLVARFLPLRERWKSETATTSELDEICGQLCRIATAIVNQNPKTLCDLGWQVEAVLTWAADFETIDDSDDSADLMLKTLLANIRSLAGPLPMISSIVPAAEMVDPTFALIAAHRSAYEEVEKAVTAADVRPSRRTVKQLARIVVGSRDETESSWTETGGVGFALIVTPTGRKIPVFASSCGEIRENVPKELQGAVRSAWIADREAELEAAEGLIAKRRARTKLGKLEAARDKAWDIERDRLWDLISTPPTTIDGLAALLDYSRERGSMGEIMRPEWQHAFEWTIECAVCAFAGLPRPPKTAIVTEIWDEQTDGEATTA
jgi:hypothetical protein